ncbi:MAG: NfeD family protein [Bacteroidales bacterium]|nr:NfeD family protein [Candidatus Sodaliphilus aphodohippi]
MIDYFSANIWQFWALLCVICLILELSSGDFFIMCFSIGAFFTAIATAFNPTFTVQVIVFIVVSVLCLMFIRPVMLKYFHKVKDERKSNAEAIIGRVGRVSETIEEGGHGRVAIDGDDWKAISADGSEIARGEKVKVVEMESIIITVERV